MNSILLSVCIPTYNRADKLRKSLARVVEAVGDRNDIEIIVSDNCSTDNTQAVLEAYKGCRNVQLYRNENNVGFNGNITLVIDKYAKGKYCWIIGDDDIIDSDAIEKLYPILRMNGYPFVSVANRCMTEDKFDSFEVSPERIIYYFEAPYFKCIDENSSGSNVLGTFMSTQIFLLDVIKGFDKSSFPVNTWDDFKTVFPNSYMMTSSFHSCNNCGCVKTPLITALSYSKDWDDKLILLVSKILPQYYNYCLDLCGGNKTILKQNTKIIERGLLSSEIKLLKASSSYTKRINLLRPRFLLYYLGVYWDALKSKLRMKLY